MRSGIVDIVMIMMFKVFIMTVHICWDLTQLEDIAADLLEDGGHELDKLNNQWSTLALDPEIWKSWGEAFVQQWGDADYQYQYICSSENSLKQKLAVVTQNSILLNY